MIRLKNNAMISDEADKMIGGFIKKGGVFKCIYDKPEFIRVIRNAKTESLHFKDALEIFKKFEHNGEQIKFSDEEVTSFAIFDRYTVYLNIFEPVLPSNKRSDVIIKNKELANYLANTFEFYWGNSKKISELI